MQGDFSEYTFRDEIANSFISSLQLLRLQFSLSIISRSRNRLGPEGTGVTRSDDSISIFLLVNKAFTN